MGKIYVGDIGTLISLDTGVDLTAAISVAILAIRPDGSKVVWIGFGLGTVINYTAQAGDLSQRGDWRLQAQVVLPSGKWSGETVILTVHNAGD
jgi:hypothetical protein